MLTGVIIDDELNSREYLRNLIDRYFSSQIHIFGIASNITEGVELIKSYNPDIVFLDVEMPGEDGFKLFEYFNNDSNFDVVFTTAHKKYAINAIKNDAFDYLLKPIDKIDILSFIKKYEKKILERKKNNTTVFDYGTNNLPKIPLSTLYGIKYIEEYMFLYAKANGSYSEINTIDGRTITLSKSLKEFEEMTSNYNFFRSHKSYIINLSHVSELIKKDEYFILLKNNIKIPLSIRRKDEFMSKIS